MADLIDRQAAIDALNKKKIYRQLDSDRWVISDCLNAIVNLPPAQPEPKKGKWEITDAYPHNVYCSECHKKFAQTQWAVWEDGSLPRNFCPNCGADMRGGDAE